MKRVYDMDEAELVALTDEQVNKLIDYECAMEGAPMLPANPGPKPLKEMPERDTTIYDVGGHLTLDQDHAARILAALGSGALWNETYEGRSYDIKYIVPVELGSHYAPKIETRRTYSAERWNQIKDQVAGYTAACAAWETKSVEYNKAVKDRCKIHEAVWNQISDARRHFEYREQLRIEFCRYLELAEGNRRVALNFLEKAKPLADYPELREEFCPPTEAEEEMIVMPTAPESDEIRF